MSVFRILRYTPEAVTGLCRTCAWGTVRRGFREGEAEAFCRLVGPNSPVRYAVRDCSDYADRSATVAALATEERRYGFVTELKLDEKNASA